MWKHRHHYVTRPEMLPKFLQSVDWGDRQQQAEAHKLYVWQCWFVCLIGGGGVVRLLCCGRVLGFVIAVIVIIVVFLRCVSLCVHARSSSFCATHRISNGGWYA